MYRTLRTPPHGVSSPTTKLFTLSLENQTLLTKLEILGGTSASELLDLVDERGRLLNERDGEILMLKREMGKSNDEELLEDNLRLRNEVEGLKGKENNDVRMLTNEVTLLEKVYLEKDSELNELRKLNDNRDAEFNAEMASNDEKVTGLKSNNAALESLIATLKAASEDQWKKNESIMSALTSASDDLASLKSKNAALESNILALTSSAEVDLSILKSKNATLQLKLKTLTSTKNDEITLFYSTNSPLEKNMATVTTNCDGLETKIAARTKTNSQNKHEIQRLESQLDDVKTTLSKSASHDEVIMQLKTELVQVKSDKITLSELHDDEISSLLDEVERLKNDDDKDSEDEINSLKAALVSVNRENEGLQASLNSYNLVTATLKASLSAHSEEASASKTKTTLLESSLRTSREETKASLSEVDILESSASDLKSDSLQIQLTRQQDENTSLYSNLHESVKENKVLMKEIEELVDRCNDLEETLDAAIAENDELTTGNATEDESERYNVEYEVKALREELVCKCEVIVNLQRDVANSSRGKSNGNGINDENENENTLQIHILQTKLTQQTKWIKKQTDKASALRGVLRDVDNNCEEWRGEEIVNR